MIPPVNGFERFVQPDGRLTPAGMVLLQEMVKAIGEQGEALAGLASLPATVTAQGVEIAATSARMAAIAAVPAPTGGGTSDGQARIAINAIRTAAA